MVFDWHHIFHDILFYYFSQEKNQIWSSVSRAKIYKKLQVWEYNAEKHVLVDPIARDWRRVIATGCAVHLALIQVSIKYLVTFSCWSDSRIYDNSNWIIFLYKLRARGIMYTSWKEPCTCHPVVQLHAQLLNSSDTDQFRDMTYVKHGLLGPCQTERIKWNDKLEFKEHPVMFQWSVQW